MQRVIIIKLLLCWSVGIVHGQQALNDSLLHLEQWIFKCTDDSAKQRIIIQKINLYLAAGHTGTDVLREINRVNVGRLSKGDSIFLWNASLISYINQDDTYARFYLKEYENMANDSSTALGLLKILIYKYSDTTVTHREIARLSKKDAEFAALTCFGEAATYQRRHLSLYLLSSAVLPGSGTALNGYPVKGLLSLALTSASVFGVVKMVEYGLYINAALWGSGVGLKFYAGNINLTESSFYKTETKHKNKILLSCEKKLESLLARYPLILKPR